MPEHLAAAAGGGGRPVIVGIRPSDLSLAAGDDAAPGPTATLSADVRVVEPLGSELHAIFSIDAPPGRQRPSSSRLHFFDPATGAAIGRGGARDRSGKKNLIF